MICGGMEGPLFCLGGIALIMKFFGDIKLNKCLGFGWFLVAAFEVGTSRRTSKFVHAAAAADTNQNDDTALLSPSSLLPKRSSSLRKLGNTKMNALPEMISKKWLTAHSDCTVQVISYLQDPDADLLAEDEEFVCELDAADAPGGYTGLTRTLGLTNEQKFMFKNMWMDGRFTPGESKFMISGVVEGVQFNSQEIQVPSGYDIMNHINWGNRIVNNDENVLLSYNSDSNILGEDERYQQTNSTTSSTTTTTDDLLGIEDDYQPSLSFYNYNESDELFNRNLQQSYGAHTGNKPMLVVKVIDVNGLAQDETPAVISDDVFGTSGDAVNLKSQMNACSMGRLTIIPGDNNSGRISQSVYSAPGVISVTIGVSLVTSSPTEIRNAVTTAVQKKLGVALPGPYKNVIYVLEKCYVDCGWAAYAFVNGWNSIYVGDNYKFVGVTMHEIGHNFGLLHSGGLDGKEYTDHSCLMGNPLYYDNIGNKMCFNGAKSWQIGWYNDRKVMLNPKTAMANNPNWSAMVTLVGVADYKNVASIPVVLKLETDTMNDYFIAFNRAVGINADNVEADDEVTVVLTGNDGEKQSQSYLKATLLVGEQFAIGKFGGGARTCVIKLDSIDKSTSVWKANVRLSTSGTLPPTVKPTSSKPTTKKPSSLKPTNKLPTAKPTKFPTKRPINKPTVVVPTDKPTPTA